MSEEQAQQRGRQKGQRLLQSDWDSISMSDGVVPRSPVQTTERDAGS